MAEQIRRILRLPEVIEITGLSRSTIYALRADRAFPPATRLSSRCIGWTQSSIHRWIEEREAECFGSSSTGPRQ